MNRVAFLIFGGVVHRFETFLFDRDVVDVANRNEDTPDAIFVGGDGGGNLRVVVTHHGDGHVGQAFTQTWRTVVVQVPEDLTADLHFKGGVNGVENE